MSCGVCPARAGGITSMGATERIDAFQQKHPAAGFPIAVLYKYFDDGGAYRPR